MRSVTPERVLHVLQYQHQGSSSGAHVDQLAREVVGGTPSTGDERAVRLAVSVLRDAGHPVCAHPNHGYFYAVSTGEINATCEFLYARAMHSLQQVASLKRKALPDLRGQLGLRL